MPAHSKAPEPKVHAIPEDVKRLLKASGALVDEIGGINAEGPDGRILLLFGNPAPQVQVDQRDDQGNFLGRIGVPARHIDQSVTRVEFEPNVEDPEWVELALSTENDRQLTLIAKTLSEEDRRYAVALQQLEQIVGVHTGGPSPAWVSCSDPDLQRVAAKHFNCAEGEPLNLFTSAGRDGLHAQHLSTSAQPASFNYMALTASTTAPASGDTTLAGEITTSGGGLVRKQATYAHTAGTNTSTLTATFTANGSDSLPVTIAQAGVLNASSSGTLGYHTALGSTATLTTSGDNVTLTWTDTAG